MNATTPLGPGGEFDLIRELMARWGPRARGIGDDAAIVDVPAGERLVVSTDSSVEGVHFRRAWLTPREIGYRATAAALSDLAAMAAAPLGVLVAISLPSDWRAHAGEIADGIGEAVDLCAVPIVGGDLTRGSELSITITVMGSALAPLTRRGARPGDRVCVTGILGGPALALERLAVGATPDPAAIARFAHPVPRIGEARWLADRGATACIDLSDGLSADAGHVAAASRVAIHLDLDRMLHVEGIDPIAAAASGEEYELLVTLPPSATVHDFEQLFRVPLTEIGRVEGSPVGSVETVQGGARVAPPRGYDHFSP